MTEFYKKKNVTNLHMFPPIITKKLSSGQNSPNFLKWLKKKREKRHTKIRRRRALKKILEKKRKKLMLKTFKTLYFHEKMFDTKEWKLIEERFQHYTNDLPPPAIVYWFLDV